MMNRISNRLTARFVAIAALLALVLAAPAVFAQENIDYPENGTEPVASFSATDVDGDPIVWTLSGPDVKLFAISAAGVLSFKKSPNFESPGDVGGDNSYNVTVNASGGSTDVVVTVTNVDEAGKVTLDDLQPQAGAAVSAGVSDPDGDTGETTWQWSKSMDGTTGWEDISGATAAGYTPGTGDIGYYLRATAEYSDGIGEGRDSASAVTAFAVERRPAANSRPAFPDTDDDTTGSQLTRMVKETAKHGSSVGNAVVANDADNDPLLYTLAGVKDVNTDDTYTVNPTGGVTAVDPGALFAVNKLTGQISVKSGANLDLLDREAYATTGTDLTDAATVLEYTVTITATDPSGSQGMVTVTIEVEKVNEAPTINRAGVAPADAADTTSGGQFVVTTPEEVALNLSGITGTVEFGGLPVFNGYDQDSDEDDITWSLSGVDAKRFRIANIGVTDSAIDHDGDTDTPAVIVSRAALRWSTSDGKGPSFEAMDSADGDNVYLVTVTASDGSASKAQAVSITVQNTEEPGSISLSQLQPQQGIAITARLSDNDGGITGTEWQWYRGATDADTATDGLQLSADLLNKTDATKCDPAADTPVTTNCWIEGATSSTYIPTAADATGGGTATPPVDPQKLTVVAKYVDAYVTDRLGGDETDPTSPTDPANPDGTDDGDMAIATSVHNAERRPNENAQPSFGDDESVGREVAENAKGASVGDPVTATDADNDPLLYTLSGDGYDNFKVDGSGQITTKKALDFETRSSYTITVTATDPSLSSGSIVVNITVTDADDPATITAGTSIEYAENGTGPVQTFTLNDQDASSGGWSVGGRDAALFKISDEGALSFKKSPNFEDPKDVGGDNTYNVTVSRSGGSLDVAITVTNEDEGGKVTLDDLQPQAGAAVSAGVTDPDGGTGETTWQWSKSMDQAEWMDIAGATAAGYTPGTGDIGYYLRATAEYSDGLGEGRDSASAATAFAVERRPAANSRPAFPDTDDDTTGSQLTRMVKETAKHGSSVGNAVVATDADNDPLLYTLAGVKDPGGDGAEDSYTAPADGGAIDPGALFAVNKLTGQISVKSGANLDLLDREAYATTGTDLTDAATVLEYTVTITATDPSGSQGMVTVTIEVEKVNEAPTINRATDGAPTDAADTTSGGQFVVTTPEEVALNLSGITGTVEFGGLPVFNGYDQDSDEDDITWSLSGVDAKRFLIANIGVTDSAVDHDNDTDTPAVIVSRAALRWSTSDGKGPSFEAMDSADGDNVYLVTVTASDGSASKAQAVSITVQNTEENGSVSLSQLRPQQGIAITARLSDNDGGITGTEWQWYRGDIAAVEADTAAPFNAMIQADELVPLTDDNKCTETTPTASPNDNCWIEGATSSTYIPTADDDGKTLTAVATYVDAYVTDSDDPKDGDDGDTARKSSANTAVLRPNENAQPSFGDDESVDRSVEENVKGASVGDPVTAIDGDSDPLLYTLSGDGSGDFKVDGSGQITTKKALDFETRSSYTITVTATDPSLSSGSIMVNITVTDADDDATVILLTGNAPEFDAEEMTRSVAENTAAGMAIGDPVTATDVDGDALTYTLGGDDAMYFTIDSMGQLMTSAPLDYETKMSFTVTVSASSGKADEMDAMTTVTIMVTDEGLPNDYDQNENGAIERDEVIAAIQDYLAGNTAKSEVTALIRLYFGEDG